MTLRTYEKWKELKRQVIKGSKAHSFNENGKALFAIEQTKELTRRRSGSYNPWENEDYGPDYDYLDSCCFD